MCPLCLALAPRSSLTTKLPAFALSGAMVLLPFSPLIWVDGDTSSGMAGSYPITCIYIPPCYSLFCSLACARALCLVQQPACYLAACKTNVRVLRFHRAAAAAFAPGRLAAMADEGRMPVIGDDMRCMPKTMPLRTCREHSLSLYISDG